VNEKSACLERKTAVFIFYFKALEVFLRSFFCALYNSKRAAYRFTLKKRKVFFAALHGIIIG